MGLLFTNTIRGPHHHGTRRSTTYRTNIRRLGTRGNNLTHTYGTNRPIKLNGRSRHFRHNIINYRRRGMDRRHRRNNFLLFNFNTRNDRPRTRGSTRIISRRRRPIVRRLPRRLRQDPLRRQRHLARKLTNRRHPRRRRRTHHQGVERQQRRQL